MFSRHQGKFLNYFVVKDLSKNVFNRYVHLEWTPSVEINFGERMYSSNSKRKNLQLVEEEDSGSLFVADHSKRLVYLYK